MTPLPIRRPLRPVSPVVLSSYDARGRTGPEVPRAELVPLREIGAANGFRVGVAPLGVRRALPQLVLACEAEGGDLRVTSLTRDLALQVKGLSKERRASGVRWNDETSWHTAGRAIDIDLAVWLASGKSLADLWELARPLGWVPIISQPDPTRAEAWHLECRGPWGVVRDRLGYEQAALAATLDAGAWRGPGWEHMSLQAQLHRVGLDVGPIDGVVGPRTRQGIAALGRSADEPLVDLLIHLHGLKANTQE